VFLVLKVEPGSEEEGERTVIVGNEEKAVVMMTLVAD
jgi:hypothetical protein